MTDTERLEWLEQHPGYTLLSNDDGKWCVALPEIEGCVGKDLEDSAYTFFINNYMWKKKIREAIDDAIMKYEQEGVSAKTC